MRKKLAKLRKDALSRLESVSDEAGLKELQVEFLGRKGELKMLLASVAELPAKERPEFGKLANEVKQEIEAAFGEVGEQLKDARRKAQESEVIDITLPGRVPRPKGHLHPVTLVFHELFDIFTNMGFEIVEGPEIEEDFYNFEALNFPPEHPARDMQDTFYLTDGRLLRTHTSPVQVRVMQTRKPPLRILAPGRVYRHDSDMTHSPMFHQLEGFIVDRDITFGDLKGVLELFVNSFYGIGTRLRFRPSFFPFTEPSVELDISCVFCGGDGCRVCKQTGFIEVLGAGMIDPNVFIASGIDPEVYSGFAFGMGIDRLAMLKYGIDDLRTLFDNDLRMISQF